MGRRRSRSRSTLRARGPNSCAAMPVTEDGRYSRSLSRPTSPAMPGPAESAVVAGGSGGEGGTSSV